MRKWLPTLLLIAAALFIAGCGGGSSQAVSSSASSANAGATNSGSTSTGTTSTSTASPVSTPGKSSKPLSKARLIARADGICKRLSVELDNPADKVQTQQDIARIAPQRAALERTALSELYKLTPSATMSHAYQQMLTVRQTLIEDVTKLGEDASANNLQAEAPVYSSSATEIRQLATTAQRSGFKYCGQLG